MNPILVLSHNCLELTKKCVESIRNQDIPTEILLWDNASTDGTTNWMKSVIQNSDGKDKIPDLHGHFSDTNRGVSVGWNWGINFFLKGSDHILVLNNDTIIPPWFYRSLLEYLDSNVLFVSGVSVGTMEEIAEPQPRKELVESPDFSAFLIRRGAWNKIGSFDENLVHYCGDMDYHIRAHRAGITLWNSGIGFYHERSSTLKNASPKARRIIELQADADRETFREMYGCAPNDQAAYAALFK